MSFSSVQGEYLTFQGGILKIILSNFTKEELKQLRTVSKEWNRTIVKIFEYRNHFVSTAYFVKRRNQAVNVSKIKLEPTQFTILFCQRKVFTGLKTRKLANDHLLNVRELKKVRFLSGRYLPPIVIDISEPYLNYWRKNEIVDGETLTGLNHSFQSLQSNQSVDVSIFQIQYPIEPNVIEEVLRDYSDEPIKSIMLFLNPKSKSTPWNSWEKNLSVEKDFRSVVERVQTEPFVSAGLTIVNDVLLPESRTDCKCEFETTIVAFRGKGLQVTSDLFNWESALRLGNIENVFSEFIKNLCMKAGPKPVTGTRVVYIFECYACRDYIWDNFEERMTEVIEMDVEVVFLRSKYNEFYTRSIDDPPYLYNNGPTRRYSSVVNVYDFLDVKSMWKDVNVFEKMNRVTFSC